MPRRAAPRAARTGIRPYHAPVSAPPPPTSCVLHVGPSAPGGGLPCRSLHSSHLVACRRHGAAMASIQAPYTPSWSHHRCCRCSLRAVVDATPLWLRLASYVTPSPLTIHRVLPCSRAQGGCYSACSCCFLRQHSAGALRVERGRCSCAPRGSRGVYPREATAAALCLTRSHFSTFVPCHLAQRVVLTVGLFVPLPRPLVHALLHFCHLALL